MSAPGPNAVRNVARLDPHHVPSRAEVESAVPGGLFAQRRVLSPARTPGSTFSVRCFDSS